MRDTHSRNSGARSSNDGSASQRITDGSKTRRRRQSQSCDACRTRKVKCAREGTDDRTISCKHCTSLGIPCKYDYQPKKRGPPNLYVRRLQEASGASVGQRDAQTTQPSALPHSAHQSQTHQVSSSPHSTHPSAQSQYLGSLSGYQGSFDPLALSPSARFAAQYVSANTIASTSTSHDHPLLRPHLPTASEESQPFPLTVSPFVPSDSFDRGHHVPSLPPSGHTVPPLPSASLNAITYRHPPRRLEDFAHRDTVSLVISLFFNFLYPLTPCIHKPSFMADLHAGKEKQDPLFFALVLSVMAATMLQVPRSYIPIEPNAVRKLARTCHEGSRLISVASYNPPTVTQVVVRYLDYLYHSRYAPSDATQHAAFGEAVHIAVTLRMHDETSYQRLDPVECEVRRRTFWILYGADKTMALLLDRPICLREEDRTVVLPKEVDDECITVSSCSPQLYETPAIVCGLNYVSRIFAHLGETLVRIRADKRSQPQGYFATSRLKEMQTLYSRVLATCTDAPEALQLDLARAGHRSHDNYGGADFGQNALAVVRDMFENPNAARDPAVLDPFLVMRAHIYVTQQLVRSVIEQHQDELMSFIERETNSPRAALDRENVAESLSNILHSIPIQCIAMGGLSLVHMVKFVYSTLYDPSRRSAAIPSSTSRARALLWTFVSILNEVERNFLFNDEQESSSAGLHMS